MEDSVTHQPNSLECGKYNILYLPHRKVDKCKHPQGKERHKNKKRKTQKIKKKQQKHALSYVLIYIHSTFFPFCNFFLLYFSLFRARHRNIFYTLIFQKIISESIKTKIVIFAVNQSLKLISFIVEKIVYSFVKISNAKFKNTTA
ncbi:hypothetical protein EDEG_03343 [Edhazardia aedis USNM 41457]|uniref:Uncharacterized protein n=1 Tax=Edhazardia aedis (strain USNM 41457) TaxID=1003232 RepID=J9DHX9_EDHAE|nr:hypothetical protein EDEG_03343 [Edhazardia aedis USNM 41457]|eukprot:EJW02225.1 hypothetical protein EDEG_03343 [Edhazardia aedis USNM 41457]